MTSKRYFTEETTKPGQISEELRVALGMSKKALPIWIHRMRILGYPPGWLRKADMTNTTINFIDGETDAGQGEVEDLQKMYNTDSFHEYPGFNAPVPKGFKDDYEKLGMPPMQQFQQLNYAKQTVQSIQSVPARRRTLDSKNNSKDKNPDESNSDSEASGEEKDPEVIDLDSTVEKEPDNQASEDESESDSGDEIIVLDVEKRSLCAALSKKTSGADLKNEEAASQTVESKESVETKESADTKETAESKETVETKETVEEASAEAQDESKPIESQDAEESKTENSEVHQDRENAAADDSQDADRSAADSIEGRESTSSRITLVSMGAPVPAALNGEKPPLENFGVGMGPMIHFENLPNSTGVFDKMRKVIKKIRKKLS